MGNKKGLLISLILLVIAVAAAIGVFVYIDSGSGGVKKYQVITESDKTHDATVVFINAGKADSILVMVDGKPSSLSGRHYWYNGHLVCKTCLIEKLLEDKVIYNNDDDL